MKTLRLDKLRGLLVTAAQTIRLNDQARYPTILTVISEWAERIVQTRSEDPLCAEFHARPVEITEVLADILNPPARRLWIKPVCKIFADDHEQLVGIALCRREFELLVDSDILGHFDPNDGKDATACAKEFHNAEEVLWSQFPIFNQATSRENLERAAHC